MNLPAPSYLSTSRLANEIARAICDGFAEFHDTFRQISLRACDRFVQRDWRGLQDDARLRMDVRDQVLRRLVGEIREKLGDRLDDRIVWIGIKAVYSGLIQQRDDWELAETFFNSVTRRVFTTVGIDPEIEFVHTDYASPPTPSSEKVYREYHGQSTVEVVRQVLADHPELQLPAQGIDEDSQKVAARVASELKAFDGPTSIVSAQFAKTVFYRGEHAYLVGRAVRGEKVIPLVLGLTNDELGSHVEAVLMRPNDVSLLFSFTRSYFLAEIARPYDLIVFINTLMPRKRMAEIYISLGYNKHGKTELYRNALRHLAESSDKYQLAAGQRGMVMVVFTMPSYPVVFKVIRNRFDFPKDCSRKSVIDRYQMVFKHDRAGRLVDAQEYEYLVLNRHRFADALLEELHNLADKSVSVEGNQVVIKHCYAERRVTPLNIYLQRANKRARREAVIDYGQAIKDLALTNLFPGDLLPKNFGVTRNGRVVFYDYDEVCLLTDCNFRKLPSSRYYDDEISAEPWFGVGVDDVFPEEFINFLGLSPDLRELFVKRHGDLLDVAFWNDLKKRIQADELFHVAPYLDDKRLDPGRKRGQLSALVDKDSASQGILAPDVGRSLAMWF